MTTRLWVVVLCLAFGAVVGWSCGSTSQCGPGACQGCCDASGKCVAGSDAAACGSGGAACSACASGVCTAGACAMADAGSGGGTAADAGACPNCNGCCQNGVCRGGAASNACGVGGATCTDCLPSNRICVTGQCQVPCGASNCPSGCCQNNQCITNTTTLACGTNGQSCVRCQPGEGCLSGLCEPVDGGVGDGGVVTCQSTCPVGCCDNADVCQAGTMPSACGAAGGRCMTCSGCRPNPTAGGGSCL